jgi:APA family basic amino acid/polyamine antiporter
VIFPSRARMFARKSIDRLVVEAEGGSRLRRELGARALVFLGTGATIGAGIYVLAGKAAREDAGPALMLSFVLAAIGCAFAALCFSELASMVPVSGSVYTYAYATLGELPAWSVGWLLILEYSVSAAAVAQGWSSYFNELLKSTTGFSIDPRLLSAPWDFDYATSGFVAVEAKRTLVDGTIIASSAWLNLPAFIITAIVTAVIVRGIRESARFNGAILILNFLIIALVVCLGVFAIDPRNWRPFFHPERGWGGVASGASYIFFAYVGFDATATYAEEARNPRRDVPIGIIGSLIICTLIYVVMTAVLTGMVPSSRIDVDAPFAAAFRAHGLNRASSLIAVGVLAATTNVVLVGILSQARIFLAMARDGLLPRSIFGAIHPKTQIPLRSTLLIGLFVGAAAALAPLGLLAKLVDIGVLFLFVVVCVVVWILRIAQPEARRSFRTPFLPVIATCGILINGYLMFSLDVRLWIGLGVWLAIGFLIYLAGAARRSEAV